MSTSRVSSEAQEINQLVQQSLADASSAAAGIGLRATALGVSLGFDVAKVIAELGSLASASARDATAKDASLGGAKSTHKTPASTRNAAADALRATIRSTRNGLTEQYGAAVVASAFPAGKTPAGGQLLCTFATQIAGVLGTQAQNWTAIPDASVAVNVAAAVTSLNAQAAALSAALQGVATADGAEGSSAADRNDSESRMHDLHKGFLHVVTGLLEMAGEIERADYVVDHHHAGHPKATDLPKAG